MHFRKAFVATALAGAPALTAAYNVNVYWGQNGDETLSTACATGGFEYITIGFINVSPENGGSAGYPGSNFAAHCWADTYPGSGLYSECKSIQGEISKCQALGKKVILSIGGEFTDTSNYTVSSADKGEQFADFVWKAFGPYDSTWTGPRPFDTATSHEVVDGYDFDIEKAFTDETGYVAMINKLRDYINTAGRPDVITGAPQCPQNDPYFDMKYILQNARFDFLNMQFYNNYDCSAIKDGVVNTDGFNFDAWSQWIYNTPNRFAQILVGLLGSPKGSDGTDASEYYATPAQARQILCEYRTHASFGGAMVWDQYLGAQNKVGDETYYQYLHDLLNGGCDGTVSLTSSSSAAVSTSSSTTSSIPCGTTPSPIQDGVPSNCNQFYQAQHGDSCWAVETKFGITDDQFHAWNPAISKDCLQNFWAGEYYCVGTGVVSSCPATTTTSSVISSTSSSSVRATSTSSSVSSTRSSSTVSSTSSSASSTSSVVSSTTSSSSSSSVVSSTSSSASSSSSSTSSSASSSSSAASSTSSSASSTSSAVSSSSSSSVVSSTSSVVSSTSSAISSTSSAASSSSVVSSTSSAVSSSSSVASSSSSSVASSSSSSVASSSSVVSSTSSAASSSSAVSSTSSAASSSSSAVSSTSSVVSSSSAVSSSTSLDPGASSSTSSSAFISSSTAVSSSTSLDPGASSSTSLSTSASSTASVSSSSVIVSSSSAASSSSLVSSSSVVSSTSSTVSVVVVSSTSSVVSSSSSSSAASDQATSTSGTLGATSSTAAASSSATTVSSLSSSTSSGVFFPNSTTSSAQQYTTSTVYTTTTYTITSCAPTVTNCPGKGQVTTEVIPWYTTVCPVTETPATTTSTPATTEASVPLTTSTIYSTTVYTITACPPSVPNCPGKGSVTTEIIAVSTTVCPVTEKTPGGSVPTLVPGGGAIPSSKTPASSPAGPASSAEATTTTKVVTYLFSTVTVKPITTGAIVVNNAGKGNGTFPAGTGVYSIKPSPTPATSLVGASTSAVSPAKTSTPVTAGAGRNAVALGLPALLAAVVLAL